METVTKRQMQGFHTFSAIEMSKLLNFIYKTKLFCIFCGLNVIITIQFNLVDKMGL